MTETTTIPVPLLDLKAQYQTIRDEINAAVQDVIEAQQFILGPEVEALEASIAAYSQCQFGVGVSSGTDALLLSLMILELQPGDEVITSSYTFFATAGVASRVGATPVFVDIDPDTYNLDPDKVAGAITERTRAIIPIHLYGQMAELEPLMVLAAQHNLTIVEDAAQAIGAELRGQRAGSIGQMGCFSFFPSKNLSAFGDAGMVTTNDPALYERLKLYRNHGYKPKYFNAVVGGNFRLDALQAAVLRVKLKYLDQWTAARQRNAAYYRTMFTDAGIAITLEALGNGEQGVVLPYEAADRRHVYNQFVIRTRHRDDLMSHLKANQIGCEVYYPRPMHQQECFADLGYQTGDLPESEAAAQETLAIPIYPELKEAMQVRVVDTITRFVKGAS